MKIFKSVVSIDGHPLRIKVASRHAPPHYKPTKPALKGHEVFVHGKGARRKRASAGMFALQ